MTLMSNGAPEGHHWLWSVRRGVCVCVVGGRDGRPAIQADTCAAGRYMATGYGSQHVHQCMSVREWQGSVITGRHFGGPSPDNFGRRGGHGRKESRSAIRPVPTLGTRAPIVGGVRCYQYHAITMAVHT